VYVNANPGGVGFRNGACVRACGSVSHTSDFIEKQKTKTGARTRERTTRTTDSGPRMTVRPDDTPSQGPPAVPTDDAIGSATRGTFSRFPRPARRRPCARTYAVPPPPPGSPLRYSSDVYNVRRILFKTKPKKKPK